MSLVIATAVANRNGEGAQDKVRYDSIIIVLLKRQFAAHSFETNKHSNAAK